MVQCPPLHPDAFEHVAGRGLGRFQRCTLGVIDRHDDPVDRVVTVRPINHFGHHVDVLLRAGVAGANAGVG